MSEIMTSEEYAKYNHITNDTVRDDMRCTRSEIDDLENELTTLRKNPKFNKVQIYMNEGRVSSREEFIKN